MRYMTLVLVGLRLLVAVPATAAPAPHKADTVVDVLMSLDAAPVVEAPARQAVEVWFQRPVVIDRKILQGHYVIEHDNNRMARGEPCTYIYAYSDRLNPVVVFHCLHLERAEATQSTVALYTTADGWQRMSEFQFKGETASHGVPTGR